MDTIQMTNVHETVEDEVPNIKRKKLTSRSRSTKELFWSLKYEDKRWLTLNNKIKNNKQKQKSKSRKKKGQEGGGPDNAWDEY